MISVIHDYLRVISASESVFFSPLSGWDGDWDFHLYLVMCVVISTLALVS